MPDTTAELNGRAAEQIRSWTVCDESDEIEYLEITLPRWYPAIIAMKRLSERFRWLRGIDPSELRYHAWSDTGECFCRLEKEPDIGTGAAALKLLQDRSPEFECNCGYYAEVSRELAADVIGSLTHYMRPRWFQCDGEPVFALESGRTKQEVIAICPHCARRGIECRTVLWQPPTDMWIASWVRRAAASAPRYRNMEYTDASGKELLIRGRHILTPTDRAIGCELLMETGW